MRAVNSAKERLVSTPPSAGSFDFSGRFELEDVVGSSSTSFAPEEARLSCMSSQVM